MPLTILPGIFQLAMSPVSETSMAPQDRELNVLAADHGEARGGIEDAGAGQGGDRLLAGVDEVGVLFAFVRKGAHAEDAVLGLEGDVDAVGDMVGDEGGNADAEVDVPAVL